MSHNSSKFLSYETFTEHDEKDHLSSVRAELLHVPAAAGSQAEPPRGAQGALLRHPHLEAAGRASPAARRLGSVPGEPCPAAVPAGREARRDPDLHPRSGGSVLSALQTQVQVPAILREHRLHAEQHPAAVLVEDAAVMRGVRRRRHPPDYHQAMGVRL